MEFVSIIRELWRRKLLLIPVFVLAVLGALMSAYKLPSMEKRSLELGAASSQILVDSPASTLVEGAESGALTTLATRARVYAQYLSSLEAREDIARESDLPAKVIATSGPFSADTGRANYEPQPSEARANDVLKEGQGYRLVFNAQEDVPIITVSAQAPAAKSATKLARASFVALQQYVKKLQVEASKVPDRPPPPGTTAIPVAPDRGVTVRELGAPEGGTIGAGNDVMVMAFAFLAVMGAGCVAITILPGVARHWRVLDRAEHMVGEPADHQPLMGPGEDPLPIRRLPRRHKDAEDEPTAAAWR
jgi:hypothetical protein